MVTHKEFITLIRNNRILYNLFRNIDFKTLSNDVLETISLLCRENDILKEEIIKLQLITPFKIINEKGEAIYWSCAKEDIPLRGNFIITVNNKIGSAIDGG